MNDKALKIIDRVYELSVEIDGITMVLAGIANQLELETGDTLTTASLASAIYAIRKHLERVSTDLENIEK